MSDINGIFQAKFITDLQHEKQLYSYLKKKLNEDIQKNVSFSYSLYGDCRNQPTLPLNLSGNIDDITNFVSNIEDKLENRNIPIFRVKILSSIDNKGVPHDCDGEHYFEIRFMVCVKEKKHWNEIVNLITPYGAHLLCISDDTKYIELDEDIEFNEMYMLRNSDSDSGIFSRPYVIMRTYSSWTELENISNEVLGLLTKHNFGWERIEKTYSVYDSNVFLDHNWIFKDVPKNFITQVNEDMLLS